MTRHALIIGIAEYASFSRLEKATGDAEAVAQILEKYGNFDTIQHLPEGWNEAKGYYIAPEKLIGNVLGEALRTFLFERAVGQEAFIYFTGHGFKTVDILGQENGYLATSDCLLETNAGKITGQRNGVSLDSLNQLLVDARLSSLLVLLDCCHSGYLIEERLMNEKLSVFNKTRNACLIASSQSFEVSYVGREHSIFTGALLTALSSDSAARDGTINSLNLIDKIESQLRRSGQQPIYMGYGNSIAVVSYEPQRAVESEVRVNRDNPYVGLDAFNREKSSYFFGREKAIQDLQMRLRQGRFLCIIGASGAGKSSLVKAGLLPTLEKQYTLDSLTPGYNPPQVLIDRLTSLHSQNRPFILFIDQFEEVFTLCKDDELRKSFFHLVAEVVKNLERQGQVIMAIRGDFLDRCAEYPEIAALANETQPTTYMVEPLTTEELYRAIAEPAKLHGVSFQGGLVERMVREVAAQPAALPLLQYALQELWRVAIEEVTSETAVLTWEEYNQIGGVGGALDKKADLIYSSFPEERERDLLRRLCLELVELGEGDTVTRRRVTKESLAAEADSPEQFERVLDSLVQSRLVAMTLHKVSEDHYESYVEVTHEALLSNWGMLRDWIAENRDNLRRKRRFEGYFATWCNAGKSEEALLSGLWLSDAEALQGQKGVRLSAEEKEFIEESVKRRDREVQEKFDNERRLREAAEANAEAERKLKLEAEKAAKAESERAKEAEARALAELEQKLEAEKATEAERERRQEAETRVKVQRQRTRFAAAAGILATVALGLGITAQYFNGAKNEREKVAVGALLGNAQTLLSQDNQLDALIASIKALKELIRLEIKSQETLNQIATIIERVQERNRLDAHKERIITVEFSPNGKILASADTGGRIIFWFLDKNIFIPHELPKRFQKDISRMRFSPDSRFVASGGENGTLNIWTVSGKLYWQPPTNNYGAIYDISFSEDGKIAASSQDGYIRVWDINKKILLNEINTQREKVTTSKPSIYGIDFDPLNSAKLVANSYQGCDLEIWDLRTKPGIKVNKCIGKNSSKIMSVRFRLDGKLIVSGDLEGTVKLWDRNGNKIGAIADNKGGAAYDTQFSPDGNFIGVAKEDGTVKVWQTSRILNNHVPSQATNNNPFSELKKHQGSVVSISFNNSGILASGGHDKSIRIWDFKYSKRNYVKLDSSNLLFGACDKLKGYLKTNEKNLSLEIRSLCQ
ncbi:caspase family protein [Oscillatoria sp. FACHB-1406]|uniref:nSTAND1 domain-containing NTPase n=1 Tax=Oscillatoria sp. FACHB-1406 TaxID=2692846 RepID=UPI001682AF09|nr:caspase family protein [Oscillatoria sp. FACHB-1406]MBD2577363.1 caspase family protein [Oscillatoria sp. FACHB-1406]